MQRDGPALPTQRGPGHLRGRGGGKDQMSYAQTLSVRLSVLLCRNRARMIFRIDCYLPPPLPIRLSANTGCPSTCASVADPHEGC